MVRNMQSIWGWTELSLDPDSYQHVNWHFGWVLTTGPAVVVWSPFGTLDLFYLNWQSFVKQSRRWEWREGLSVHDGTRKRVREELGRKCGLDVVSKEPFSWL